MELKERTINMYEERRINMKTETKKEPEFNEKNISKKHTHNEGRYWKCLKFNRERR